MDMYQKRKIRQERKNSQSNQESVSKVSISWYPGHMAKTKRQIAENLNLIDIVFEVIDARIPISSKNKDIDNLIKNKPRVLIMTKKDMCDLEKTNKFVTFYEEKGYKVILLDLLTLKNNEEILKIIDPIVEELNKKRANKGMKPRKVRILVLGIPNVGKSTLINRLVGKKATNIGNRPGVTKQLEWIRINNKIELLDTPGILWPKLDNNEVALNLAATTAIKEEVLDLEEVAIHIIKKLQKKYPNNLSNRYNLDKEEEIIDILDKIGKKIGAIRNGEVDYDKVYLTILKDLKEGYLGKVTLDEL